MKLIYLSLVLIMSCSHTNTSQNIVKTSDTSFHGGTYKNESWNDKLYFERISWYHGGTLFYDALLHKFDKKSKWVKWMSASEKDNFEKCHEYILAIMYASNSIFTNINHSDFKQQMEHNGFTSVSLMNFDSYMRIHPTFEAWNMRQYKVEGFCRNSPGSKTDMTFNLPGFKETKANLKKR